MKPKKAKTPPPAPASPAPKARKKTAAPSGATTAGGKTANVATMQRAEAEALQGAMERHAEGHRSAGRETPLENRV